MLKFIIGQFEIRIWNRHKVLQTRDYMKHLKKELVYGTD